MPAPTYFEFPNRAAAAAFANAMSAAHGYPNAGGTERYCMIEAHPSNGKYICKIKNPADVLVAGPGARKSIAEIQALGFVRERDTPVREEKP